MTKRTQTKIFGFIALFAIATVVQALVSAKLFYPDRVVVWVFDVGQGDAIFIDAPDAQVLIDGGPSDEVLEKLSAVMPFWDRTIDLVVLTHPHEDHVRGLTDVLERYDVGEVWVDGQRYNSEVFDYFESLSQGISKIVVAGESISLGNGAELEVVWPFEEYQGQQIDDPNDGSIVTLLTYGEGNMLFTGDVGVEEEEQFMSSLSHVDVLKVGHHGSRTSTGISLLGTITPDYAVISVGADNDYGHPHEIVLDRLEEIVSTILRTDLDDNIRVILDGGEPSVATLDL